MSEKMFDTFMERLELSIDSMGDDYYAPELITPEQRVPLNRETAILAGRIWVRLGMKLLRRNLE